MRNEQDKTATTQERFEDNEMAFGIFLHRWCVIPRIVCHCVWSIYGAMCFSHPTSTFLSPSSSSSNAKRSKASHTKKKQPRKFDWADRVTKAYMHEHNERVNQCHLHQMLAQPHSTSEERQFFSILFYFIYRVCLLCGAFFYLVAYCFGCLFALTELRLVIQTYTRFHLGTPI